MAKYEITSSPAALEIRLTGVAGQQEALLEAFGECQQGQCSCPTDEYEKLERMEVDPTADAILIRLEAKPGEHLDNAEIARCLDYTIEKTAK